MNRRIYRAVLPLVAALGLVAVAATPADAAGPYFAPAPFSGSCKYQYSWNGSGTSWYIQAPNYPYNGPTCTAYVQFKWLCGTYPNTNTYYWIYTSPPTFVNQLPYSSGQYSLNPACPYGGAIINWAIAVSAYPLMICWNHNAAASGGPGWVYNGHSGPFAEHCFFE